MVLYHERQHKNYCRCHALNNLFGRRLITIQEFDALCDEFDKLNSFVKGSSRNNFLFYNNGDTKNIFGFICKKKKQHIGMKHYDFYKNKHVESPTEHTIGYIVFTHQHTYCVHIERSTKIKYVIDSMRPTTTVLHNMSLLHRKQLGVIEVYEIQNENKK